VLDGTSNAPRSQDGAVPQGITQRQVAPKGGNPLRVCLRHARRANASRLAVGKQGPQRWTHRTALAPLRICSKIK
jgi:hypothetical protein